MKSFGAVAWKVLTGKIKNANRPTVAAVVGMKPSEVRMDGTNPEYVGGRSERIPMQGGSFGGPGADYVYESSVWELHNELQDSAGDGTVPVGSGALPKAMGGASILQQFKLMDIQHEPAYRNVVARAATLYAITKIVGTAMMPA